MPEPKKEPPVPARIGKFKIERGIGHGAMGVVYRARQEDLDRAVAIKVIRPDYRGAMEILSRFRREARSIARLNHPGIVQIHDVGEDQGRSFIVMELAEGASPADAIARKCLSVEQAIRVARELAEAVAFAHERGIIHRDRKPTNIALTPDGRPKILEFGIAKIEQENAAETQPGEVVGTPLYMSPEQAFGAPGDVDARSDVYSLGVFLYEMPSGASPYSDGTMLSILRRIDYGNFRKPSEVNPRVSPRLDGIVSRAMAREPSRRFATAREMA